MLMSSGNLPSRPKAIILLRSSSLSLAYLVDLRYTYCIPSKVAVHWRIRKELKLTEKTHGSKMMNPQNPTFSCTKTENCPFRIYQLPAPQPKQFMFYGAIKCFHLLTNKTTCFILFLVLNNPPYHRTFSPPLYYL